MLDIQYIVNNLEQVRTNCELRGYEVEVDIILQLYSQRKHLISLVDDIRRRSKSLAKLSQGEIPDEERRLQAKELNKQEANLARQLKKTEEKLQEKLSWLPNMLDPRVPIGGEDENQVIRQVGKIREFNFPPLPHEELGKKLNLIDIPRGVKTAKTRFYCLKNEAVRLRYALIQMFTDKVTEQGFELVSPPYLTKDLTLYASGYLPFAQKDNFKVVDEDLSLIGTSEQSLLGIHLNEILTDLPLLYLGDSMCFRTEAGSYGRDTAGILRVHQFYKLEQIVYCHPDESEAWHLKCLENEEWLMQELEIPYQVVVTASQDLAAPGRMKYDTEAWIPSQGKYRETTSNTNMGDYQTRRGSIRFKIGKEKGFPHTISATGFCDRLIIAILENYQQADGSIVIPQKLVPYMGGLSVIQPK